MSLIDFSYLLLRSTLTSGISFLNVTLKKEKDEEMHGCLIAHRQVIIQQNTKEHSRATKLVTLEIKREKHFPIVKKKVSQSSTKGVKEWGIILFL